MKCPKCDSYLVRSFGSQEVSCEKCEHATRQNRTSLTEYFYKGDEIKSDELPTKAIKLSKSRQRILTINGVLQTFLRDYEYQNFSRNENLVISPKELQILLLRVFLAGMKHKDQE